MLHIGLVEVSYFSSPCTGVHGTTELSDAAGVGVGVSLLGVACIGVASIGVAGISSSCECTKKSTVEK